ncbi:MAG: hypothetical protein GQE15_41795 [Archangiaceae bacterium]|nr:hypothetical protein [Archangiaceae bacterium]
MNLLFAIVMAAAPADFDLFLSSELVQPALQRDDVFTAHVEPRLGVPTVLWALQVGPEAPAWTRADLSPAEAARRHLLPVANSFRLSGETVARLDHRHTLDLGHGAIVVTFGRSFDGVALFRDELHVVMTQARELIAITGNVNPATPKERGFRLTGTTAVATAARELGFTVGALSLDKERDGWQRVFDSNGLVNTRARRVWYGLPDALEPAWHVELDSGDSAFFEVVSAWDGRLLSRKNLTVDATWRVYAETAAPFAPADSPYGTGYTPHPTGVRLPPIEGDWVSSSLVTLDFAPGARSDPWLPANATTLQGNNAFSFVDLFPPFGLNSDAGLADGGMRPQDQLTPMSAPGVFDYSYDPDAGPTPGAQANAANTHLFYTVNWLHDWALAAGFDEAAGNGQKDNLGHGGKADDALSVSAFSFARPNNASMTTLADGETSRMQMGNFSAFQVRYLDLSVLDAGRAAVTSTGPLTPVTAPISVMQSDAGANGCDELFDPSALSGRIAVAYAQGCNVRESFNRALDAGAAALIVVSANNAYPNLFIPDASITVPLIGVTAAPSPFLTALDAGAVFSPTYFTYQMPARPSALDTQVITHEFGHFIANRLIADTAGLQLQISGSMGEGWSDFFALLQTVRASDARVPSNANWSGVFGTGGYVVGGPDDLGRPLEHHWSGIRRYPYTVDTEKNGLSFRHIRDGAALPPGIVGTSQLNSEVHAAGEVWCTMLWEGFVGHLRATPDFERARRQMLETLIAALKATPANPDFLEARDAMLAVAFAADPAFFRTLYSGFAKRGAGPRAEAPSKLATNNAPVLEDTSMGDAVKITAAGVDDSRGWCDRDGRLDVGESGLLNLTARNVGFAAISAPQTLKVRALSQGVVIEGDGLVTFAPSAPFGVVRASTPVRLESATDVRMLEFRVDTVGQTPASTSLVTVLANADVIASATEDFEGSYALDRGTGWRRGDDLEANDYFLVEELWHPSPQTPTQTLMNGPNATSRGHSWLTTPALAIGAQPVTVRFKHRYQFESSSMTQWDGAYVEVSEDGQQTWTQVTTVVPAYSGTISTTTPQGRPSTNPSAGQAAWVGTSNGYPAFLTQTLNLGTRYANKTIHLRFVIATDANGGRTGWDLDDVEVAGLSSTPFTQRVADRQQCVNRPPTLEAGPPRDIAEKQQVTLTASVMDPDGDPVTLTWAQVGGPSVSLSGETFTAPDVTQDTPLEFEVTAKDAALESKDRLTLTVKAVNAPPQVMASGPNVVRSGQQFTLTGTGIDADGDALVTTFVQTRGPLAKDLGGGKFQAPPVKEPDRMYFDVIVSDGQARAIFPLEVGLEPSACGCTASPLDVFGFALAALLLRRRKR